MEWEDALSLIKAPGEGDEHVELYKNLKVMLMLERRAKIDRELRDYMDKSYEAGTLWLNVGAYSDVIIPNGQADLKGVKNFLAHNSLLATEKCDVAYASVMMKLVEQELIELPCIVEDKSGYVAADISADVINQFSGLARNMLLATIFALSEHHGVSELPRWYHAFCRANGGLINESNFLRIIQLIAQSRGLRSAVSNVTLGELRRESKALKYSMSTPMLIKKAFKMILPYPKLFKWFDPAAVKHYQTFEEAGIIAVVASGMLSFICKGNVDPMLGKAIDDTVTIRNLSPISLGYHGPIIRRARIILEVFGIDFGEWYQGEKAMNDLTIDDVAFRFVIEGIRDKGLAQGASSLGGEGSHGATSGI